jgi:Protein of unknown function (DUF2934)
MTGWWHEHRVQERAYEIWEKAGRPEGKAVEHLRRAKSPPRSAASKRNLNAKPKRCLNPSAVCQSDGWKELYSRRFGGTKEPRTAKPICSTTMGKTGCDFLCDRWIIP